MTNSPNNSDNNDPMNSKGSQEDENAPRSDEETSNHDNKENDNVNNNVTNIEDDNAETWKRMTMMKIRAVILAWEKMKVPLKKVVKNKMKKTHMQGSLMRRKAVLRSPKMK